MSFFLALSCKVLDSARTESLTRDVSVRVHFRLRGGMVRVPRDSPGQWTCDYCTMNRCWVTRSTCYTCGEARGHTEERRQHFRNMAREAREGGASNGASAAAAASTPAPWANRAQPARRVPPRTAASSPPWRAQPPAHLPLLFLPLLLLHLLRLSRQVLGEEEGEGGSVHAIAAAAKVGGCQRRQTSSPVRPGCFHHLRRGLHQHARSRSSCTGGPLSPWSVVRNSAPTTRRGVVSGRRQCHCDAELLVFPRSPQTSLPPPPHGRGSIATTIKHGDR